MTQQAKMELEYEARSPDAKVDAYRSCPLISSLSEKCADCRTVLDSSKACLPHGKGPDKGRGRGRQGCGR